MNIRWNDSRCILCLEELPLTSEHVIPQVLGGRLKSAFLCARCNSELGTSQDAKLKSDAMIRGSALELRPVLPGLVEALDEGGAYVGSSAIGEFQGTVKKGVFRPRPLRPGDGSLMLANPEAREAIVRMLKKEGRDAEIPAALERFDAARPNDRIEVAPGIQMIEWQTERIRPVLEVGAAVPDTWPLKTAYEFLAFCLGRAIYSDVFQPYREILRSGSWNGDAAGVERLQAEQLSPLHGLLLEPNAPHTVVQVRLFRRVCYRVHFRRIAATGPRVIYSQNLAEPSETLAILES